MMFQQTLLLPFHLADPAGVLFFSHALTLAHQTFEAFVVDGLQLPWESWFQHKSWIVPLKQASADYLAPLHAGRPCTIELSITSLRESSFQVSYTFFQEGKICCQAQTVHVFCHPQGGRVTIPPSIKDLLQRFCLQPTLDACQKLSS